MIGFHKYFKNKDNVLNISIDIPKLSFNQRFFRTKRLIRWLSERVEQ